MAVDDGVRVEWNESELRAIARQEYTRNALAGFGGRIGADARAAAPRGRGVRGHMADTIRGSTVLEGAEWTVRVTWDQLHAYARFPEFGTKHQPAQHFLLHAADRYARP